jgi:hypothetical protein
MLTSRGYCRFDERESSSRVGGKGDYRITDARTVKYCVREGLAKGREREGACQSRLDKAGPGRR